jgi:hypothetical protein
MGEELRGENVDRPLSTGLVTLSVPLLSLSWLEEMICHAVYLGCGFLRPVSRQVQRRWVKMGRVGEIRGVACGPGRLWDSSRIKKLKLRDTSEISRTSASPHARCVWLPCEKADDARV